MTSRPPPFRPLVEWWRPILRGESSLSSSARFVAGAVADHADVVTGECTLRVSTLARETQLGASTVRRAIGELRAAGLLLVTYQVGRASIFTLRTPPGAGAPPPGASGVPRPERAPPRPERVGTPPAASGYPARSGRHKRNTQEVEEEVFEEEPPRAPRAIAPDDESSSLEVAVVDAEVVDGELEPRVTFRGRVVAVEVQAAGVAALAHFAVVSGHRIAPFTAIGRPSSSLTRILGAMLEHPEVQDERLWRRMIDRAFAAPWWRDDGRPAGVGVVFGPGYIDQSIAVGQADEPPKPRRERDSASAMLDRLGGSGA